MQQSSLSCQCGTIGDASNSIYRYISECGSTVRGDRAEASSVGNIFHEYCIANLSPVTQLSATNAAAGAGSTVGL